MTRSWLKETTKIFVLKWETNSGALYESPVSPSNRGRMVTRGHLKIKHSYKL